MNKTMTNTKNLPRYWQQIKEIALEIFHENETDWSVAQASDRALALVHEYRQTGTLKSILFQEALYLPDLVGVLFFEQLAEYVMMANGRPVSPVAHYHDDRWMNDWDLCFFNVRAVGKEVNRTGNFIEATRILPLIRARGMHLGPFFECTMGIIYALHSFSIINDEVVHPEYEARGVNRYDQLRYFVDCNHILGKTVGVDLTPHTAGFSRINFTNPELFRWVRFSADRKTLFAGETIDDQYSETRQKEIVAEVKALCAQILEEYGLETFEGEEVPLETGREMLGKARELVRKEGYFPVPPPTWNGIGVPGVKEFYYPGDYPIWDYRDIYGDDQSIHSIGIHTSFVIHRNMRANRLPKQFTRYVDDWEAEIHEETVQYLAEFFPRMHRHYGFDFLRMDYVDHVFDLIWKKDGKEVSRCDQLTPMVIHRCKEKAREAFPAAAFLADHVGSDIEDYRSAGFTAILGEEIYDRLTAEYVIKAFERVHLLETLNAPDGPKGTIAYNIDTHDMAHPLVRGKELPEREEPAHIQLRHFFSRFSSAGLGIRPKYEVIGNQDLSTGIYRANNRPESLLWGNNRGFYDLYHHLEDVYDRFKQYRITANVSDYAVYDDYCWWRIDCKSAQKSWIALTWVGETYTFIPRHTEFVKIQIPLPDGLTQADELLITPLYGVHAPEECDDDEMQNWLLASEDLQYTVEQGNISIKWPKGSVWFVQVEKK